jgi:hypothetical protein
MNPDLFSYGFRIVGPTTGERRLVDWQRAFGAYCAAAEAAHVEQEAYLSAFTFGRDFREHLSATGSTKGYSGPCGASWCWWDIDRADDLDAALRDARALCVQLPQRFAVSEESVLVFYSGSKGFHVGLPLAGFDPRPGPLFHRTARRFAEHVADVAGVTIDTGVYDRVRAFRAPNSLHPATGRHKRRLTVDEVLRLSADGIVELAATPEPFDLADLGGGACGCELPAAWNRAADEVRHEAEAEAEHRAAIASGETLATLNRVTLDFIRDGAAEGDRHRMLFSASANLAECRATVHLCRELLTAAGLDSGLSPAEVERQIRCGWEHGAKGGAA